MLREIELKGKKIYYEFSQKRVKNINMRISRDGKISVSASIRTPVSRVEDFIRAKADWVIKALESCEKRNDSYNENSLFLWGDEYVLILKAGKCNALVFTENEAVLTLKDIANADIKEKFLKAYYKEECKQKVTSICKKAYETFGIKNLSFPEIKFREMKTRWGSCHTKNKILTFNTALAKFPIACAEYVVFHEFTHFLCANHSAEFYTELSKYMPDWKERKKLLSDLAITLKI